MAESEKTFDDGEAERLREDLQSLAQGNFADYLTLKEVAKLTGSSYAQVYYAITCKIELRAVRHGVQWFVHWRDARSYSSILRERRLRRAAHLNRAAERIEKRAERRLRKAKATLHHSERAVRQASKARG